MTELETALAQVLAREVKGFRGLRSCERLSGGASQETYRLLLDTVDGELTLAMRRAPGGETDPDDPRPGLAGEAKLMQVAKAAGVPEPDVVHVLQPQDQLGEGFIMQWLDGVTLGARVVKDPSLDAVRPRLAYLCGEALARIHQIDVAACGVDQFLQTLGTAEYIEQTWQRYRDFDTAQPMIDYTARWLLENIPADQQHTLVHNDFRNGNVMFDEQGLVAVLDWEIAHIGDPMRDLGWICTNSWRFGRTELPVGGFGHYADLFAGYESVTGVAVDPERVKFWEVFGSFWWSVGCLGMADHYRNGPDQSVERPAIGRRSSECQVDCVNLLMPGAVTPLPTPAVADSAMPRAEELLLSVRDFLREDVMQETHGRTQFLARVAANSLDIVHRQSVAGTEAQRLERARLAALFPARAAESLESLRAQLVRALRDGTLALSNASLQAHLRQTVADQVGIDQPRYSGYRTLLANS